MTARNVHWFGSQALLIDLASLDEAQALHAHLLTNPLAGQVELVPASRTLLIRFHSHYHAAWARPGLATLNSPENAQSEGRLVIIDVVYDGEDLPEVAQLTGLSEDEVIAIHTGQNWRAAFSGFAPGFVYMVGENRRLEVPRRESPRTAVPPGAVGLAGHFSAVYPRRSPGGWQLIGRTDARLWDLERDPPALIQAGDRIQYRAVKQLSGEAEGHSNDFQPLPEVTTGDSQSGLEILATGLQSLLQDTGRPDLSHLGVPASGAADDAAFREVNRLVGNTPASAVIENPLGGLTLRAHGDQILALGGANCRGDIDGRQGPRHTTSHRPFILHDRETLTLPRPTQGLRCYLGIRGSIDIKPVLGSRATDVLSSIGPEPLAVGHWLPVTDSRQTRAVETGISRETPDTTTLRIIFGPRDDWFSADTCRQLQQQRWMVTESSNRVGLRFALDAEDDRATPLARQHEGELASEGMQPGALQVPPSGLPVLFLRDHPVTGGYPVMATVIAQDLPLAAQVAPGQAVQFTAVDPDTLQPLGNNPAPAPSEALNPGEDNP